MSGSELAPGPDHLSRAWWAVLLVCLALVYFWRWQGRTRR